MQLFAVLYYDIFQITILCNAIEAISTSEMPERLRGTNDEAIRLPMQPKLPSRIFEKVKLLVLIEMTNFKYGNLEA